MNSIEYGIASRVGIEAMYEQLAEEASELAHAALKMARVLRGVNPTPVTLDAATAKVLEEYADVTLCARMLNLYASNIQMQEKLLRWRDRLEDAENDLH